MSPALRYIEENRRRHPEVFGNGHQVTLRVATLESHLMAAFNAGANSKQVRGGRLPILVWLFQRRLFGRGVK